MDVTVIGCGRWGTLIAWYLDRIGHRVTLYGREGSARMAQLMASRCNRYMELPQSVTLSTDWDCIRGAQAVVVSVPAQGFRPLARQLSKTGNRPVILCMKGLERETGKRLSQVAKEELGPKTGVAVWLGPGHVQEFYRGVPNCMVIDSQEEELKQRLVDQLSSELIRFYYGRDLIGNELGAASKNVIGIAAGMLDGLGLTTLKGALMSRGTREIARLIAALGGDERSAYGLCHLGDYEATVFSPHSHNREFGQRFVQGQPYDQLAEGYYTVCALRELALSHQVELPICQAVYGMLYQGADPGETLTGLFTRSLKNEF